MKYSNGDCQYIAHKREDGVLQPLHVHLQNVASLTARFAGVFDQEKQGERVGILHDRGKYAPDAQRRMRDPVHVAKVNHTSAGALAAMESKDLCGAFAVACHHGGLRDYGSKSDSVDAGTLHAKLKYRPKDTSAFDLEIPHVPSYQCPEWLKTGYSISFYTRMLFSCLVDADYLDTEEFMRDGDILRGGGDSVATMLDSLTDYLQTKGYLEDRNGDAINACRRSILRRCLRGSEFPQGLYTLTVPTGGGKTLSSLAFALSHAASHGQSRVIYVIPYTSIIEQNAKVFEKAVGKDNVLEHHSHAYMNETADTEDDEGENAGIRRLLMAAENWDSPIVVTTAVQFFESLYAAKVSKCRKLHNIANSVIIFDEAQMLPCEYLPLCVKAIGELTANYHVTAVLCTATQPSLDRFFEAYGYPGPKEIVEDTRSLFPNFQRVTFVNEGHMDVSFIASRLSDASQALCIVNTRKQARDIYEAMSCNDKFYLTTLITPRERSLRLREIRDRLKAGLPCRVVSTSLIEAGVDVDFPCVWRETAGLDSILQAAGRCNREGKRKREESCLHVFDFGGRVSPLFDKQISAMQNATENGEPYDNPDTIRRYFDGLYRYAGNTSRCQRVLKACETMSFKTIADNFSIIDQQTATVYIPNEDNRAEIHALEAGTLSRSLLRRLQQDAVNVYEKHFDLLRGSGKVKDVGNGIGILEDEQCYSPQTGLDMKGDSGAALFV